MGQCHLLVDEQGKAILLDTGLAGELFLLKRLLSRLGLAPEDLQAIVVTHGHLDHVGNLATFQKFTGAPIYAHPEEQAHIDGTYRYQGLSRCCGLLEGFGRMLFRTRPAAIQHPLRDGDFLPFWGGLEVVHLPGHTRGHCGFYSRKRDLLFTGDLFSSYIGHAHVAYPILNSCPEFFPSSFERVEQLNPSLIMPNHYDIPDPALHRRRFDRLLLKLRAKRSPMAVLQNQVT